MKLGERVRFYEGEWFSTGTIESIEGNEILVDFMDWKSIYEFRQIKIEYLFFRKRLTTTDQGKIVEDFRSNGLTKNCSEV